MGGVNKWDDLAARLAGEANPPVIAGYLPYNPGPGIYSRLERAVEAMPENVRVQELPGLLKRYKDGVPGWELKETDLDSVIAGRDVVPRSELLARVKEQSPVYTHGEVVLGGRPQRNRRGDPVDAQEQASPLGQGVSHGDPLYSGYSQGGKDYTEILLTQPGQSGLGFDSHWAGTGKAQDAAVAHARFDTHGDALRIGELQSDLGIHNRRMLASGGKGTAPAQLATETDEDYMERLSEAGWRGEWGEDGEMVIRGQTAKPFPTEDDWSDLLIKRLALEAARGGHRAIEVASPASVFAKTGNRGDAAASLARMEHFYGKVVPGAVERLGRKMGGLTEEPIEQLGPVIRYELPFDNGQGVLEPRDAAEQIFRREFPRSGWPRAFEIDPRMAYNKLEWAYSEKPESVGEYATILQTTLAKRLQSAGVDAIDAERLAGQRMPEIVRLAEEQAMRANAFDRVQSIRDAQEMQPSWKASRLEAGRRYVMSDEMRRRIIEGGIGASLLAPLASQYEEER